LSHLPCLDPIFLRRLGEAAGAGAQVDGGHFQCLAFEIRRQDQLIAAGPGRMIVLATVVVSVSMMYSTFWNRKVM